MGAAFSSLYLRYKGSAVARVPKLRRYRRIIRALNLQPGASILEVGCSSGADFLRFAMSAGYRCHGLDIARIDHICGFEFTQCDAAEMPFRDKSFDAVVSIGVLEHIAPVEKLCAMTREIARVGKRFCIVIPSITTLIEPHTLSLLWPLRDRNRKTDSYHPLYFYSDEVWLQFPGFEKGRTERFSYLPGIRNLMVAGPEATH